MGSEHSKRCSEAAQFLGVIESSELPSDGSDIRLSIELVGQQLRSQSATGICVRGHQTDAIAAGRVARDAKHRNALLRKAMDDWIELSWISRGEDNAVVRLFQSGFQELGFPLPHPRILMKGDLYVKSDGGVCSGLYSGTQGIEEMRDLLRKNNRDFDSAVELQGLSGQVGFVSQPFGHLLNACFGLQTDARALVQRSIHRSDRHTECFGDVFDASSFRCGLHRSQDSGMRRKIYAKAIVNRLHDFSGLCSRRAYREFHCQSILQPRLVVIPGDFDRAAGTMWCDS